MRTHALTLVTLMAFCSSPLLANETADSPPGKSVHKPNTAIAATTNKRDERARAYFTDRMVISQQGAKLRFYSDVLRDRIVLISLFFTNCTGICPLTNQKLAKVQDLLGDEIGRKIFILSLTVDPNRDTPEVLRSYAKKFAAGDGWLFLSGEKEDIKVITSRLGQTTPDVAAHNPFFMVGDVARVQWKKIAPNASAASIVARLRLMAEHTPKKK